MPSKSHELYETISHKTAAAPYSLHQTEMPYGVEPALYLHWHNEMEFFLLLEGELLFHVEDESYNLHSGDGIFIPPGALHCADNTGTTPVTFRAFVLSPDFIFSPFDTNAYNTYILPILHNNLSYILVLRRQVDWQELILRYLQELFAQKTVSELYVRGISLFIWHELYQHYISKIGSEPTLRTLANQLSGAISYLQSNYDKPLSLSGLSTLVHLSEAQFCRSFKRLTGMTPFRYLIRYRILQSCTELCHTDKKITAIALSCGFNNISYYNRAFLQIMNMTPSEYRKSRTRSRSCSNVAVLS